MLVTLPGMDYRGHMSEYLQAVAAAREIVAGMPEGMGEYEKALYLYQWLTENVRYDRNDYYEGAWTLLYDTLVKRETVCAGYAEALYVLYNLAGIECFTVSGYLNDPLNGGAGHIWNVAKIDGEYYQFDSTWDEGVPPEGYHFFGVSADRLQLYYPRHVETLAEEYCPACTKSLPLPDGRPAIPASGELSSGALEEGRYRQAFWEGRYRQAFWDLQLYVDESWTPYSREQIAEALYTEPRLASLDVGETLAMGLPYVDLMLERGSGTVQVLLERGPITTSNGESCDSPEDYMDNLALTLPEMMKNYGLTQTNCRRYETEICGRSYACLAMTARSGWVGMTETYLCTQRDGIFLTLVVASSGDSEKLVRELVNGLEGEGA